MQRALDSLLSQTCGDWEVLISPDDGADYSGLLTMDSRVRLVDSAGAIRTGPGPARNRALDCAVGQYVTCLDDDDTVAANFVEVCLEALQTYPAIVVPSVYVSADLEPIRTVAIDTGSLDIAGFADLYATLHVICRRDLAKPWGSFFAEDVLHTCTAIENNGGSIHVATNTEYRITLRDESLCATQKDIGAAYAQLIDWIDHQQLLAEWNETARINVKNLLMKRLQMQRRYERREDRTLNYQSFVQQYLADRS